MADSERARPTRRNILLLSGMTASAVSASVPVRARSRYAINTARDFIYEAFGTFLPPHAAATHPMQYLLSPPKRARAPVSSTSVQPGATVIAIDGADHHFRGRHAVFARARRNLPFALVTPFVVSNGGRRNRSYYPYSAEVLSAATSDPLGFDLTGVSAIIHEMRDRFGAGLPVYLAGFSARGHLAWLLVLTHPDWLTGAALASANFAGRGLTPGWDTEPATHLPVRVFFGAADRLSNVLLVQWDRARTLARQRGCRDLTRVVVPDAGHSPFAREVLEFFAELALAQG